ncbi:hypothetical protein GCM10022199_26940 [Marihabitans asiaticum]|uniref:O-antigen ligase n=1 Tax=Marihabitans asiaticum TaxID=415218 RepID=A0A560WD53_9MICO|nr:O-antigen ligase family protein [Marihabitans asiaticum]TWD15506.1 O-antigen ligase [Marihabitans asiaticum]
MKERLLRLIAGLGLTLGALIVGYVVPGQPLLAVAVSVGVLAMGLSAINRAFVPLLVLPVLFIVGRVSYSGVDVSISDVGLAVATLPAVALSRTLSPAMRSLMWLIALYLFSTLFTVAANPYLANVIEWVHSAVLLGGALFVGWSVGREGFGAKALSVMLTTASAISLLVIISGVTAAMKGSFEPVFLDWPFGMHKNFIGTTLGIMAVVAYVHPVWMGWSKSLGMAVFAWLTIGVAFSQSRQAIIALGIALIVLVLRTRTQQRRPMLIVFAVITAFLYVLSVVREQASSSNEFNSFFQRLAWFSDSIEVWQTSPVFGVGLRWWYTDTFDYRFQPPNAELEVLTSAGIIGLVAFLILITGSLTILWRLPPEYGTLAALVVLSRFVQAQFDLFWTAVQVSLPFVIVGICLGELARVDSEPKQHSIASSLGESSSVDESAVVQR